MKENRVNTVQPSDLFNLLEISEAEREKAEKLLSVAYTYLVSLNTGDKLVTSNVTFHKLDVDLLQIEVNLNPKNIIDELGRRNIIKVPV
jgi:hypothetical protein